MADEEADATADVVDNGTVVADGESSLQSDFKNKKEKKEKKKSKKKDRKDRSDCGGAEESDDDDLSMDGLDTSSTHSSRKHKRFSKRDRQRLDEEEGGGLGMSSEHNTSSSRGRGSRRSSKRKSSSQSEVHLAEEHSLEKYVDTVNTVLTQKKSSRGRSKGDSSKVGDDSDNIESDDDTTVVRGEDDADGQPSDDYSTSAAVLVYLKTHNFKKIAKKFEKELRKRHDGGSSLVAEAGVLKFVRASNAGADADSAAAKQEARGSKEGISGDTAATESDVRLNQGSADTNNNNEEQEELVESPKSGPDDSDDEEAKDTMPSPRKPRRTLLKASSFDDAQSVSSSKDAAPRRGGIKRSVSFSKILVSETKEVPTISPRRKKDLFYTKAEFMAFKSEKASEKMEDMLEREKKEEEEYRRRDREHAREVDEARRRMLTDSQRKEEEYRKQQEQMEMMEAMMRNSLSSMYSMSLSK